MSITKVSDKGIKELIKSEGVRTQVYDDRGGKTVSSYQQVQGYPTIGVGHRIMPNEEPNFSKYLRGKSKMSENEVFSLLKKDLPKYSEPVRKRIKKPVTQAMFDALVSLAYNAGPNASSVKKAIAKINEEDYNAAAQAILNGPTKSKGRVLQGLVKRRQKEYQMFLSEGKPSKIKKAAKGLIYGVGFIVGTFFTASIAFVTIKKLKG